MFYKLKYKFINVYINVAHVNFRNAYITYFRTVTIIIQEIRL